MKFREMLRKSPSDVVKSISSLSEAKKVFHTIYKSVQSRIKTFEKHGAEGYVPKKVRGIKSVKGKTEEQIKSDIRNMLRFAGNVEIGTYEKAVVTKRERVKKIKEKMKRRGVDVESLNVDDLTLRKFLADAGERYSNDASFKLAYGTLLELYAESERLNLNPNQFIRNLKYWVDHVDELKNAEPIDRSNVKPSDYAKKLGLEKIGNYEKYSRTNEETKGKKKGGRKKKGKK